MVIGANIKVLGFGSRDAAQQYIDRVCMAVAPNQQYKIIKCFNNINGGR